MANLSLFYVQLQGMRSTYGNAYVVATGLDEAVNKVISYLNDKDIGFSSDRVFDSIKLLATLTDTVPTPGSGICKLYL